MGHEILYNRQFIDLSNGTYIPLILSGSSDRTMRGKTREINERHWSVFGGNFLIGKTKEELLSWMKAEIKKSEKDRKWFMRRSQWMTNKTMLPWVKNGIESAHTIECILKYCPAQYLHCFIEVRDKKCSDSVVVEYDKRIYNSTELVLWVECFKKREKEKMTSEVVTAFISFAGAESLGLGINKDVEGPVVCRVGQKYLRFYDENRYSCCENIENALIFDDIEDFQTKTRNIEIKKYQLVSVTGEAYIISFGSGEEKTYVLGTQKLCLKTTEVREKAKTFVSRSTGLRYVEKLKERFPFCEGLSLEKK